MKIFHNSLHLALLAHLALFMQLKCLILIWFSLFNQLSKHNAASTFLARHYEGKRARERTL